MGRNLQLERHTFAPELNKLFYKGVCFKVPGALTVQAAITQAKLTKPEFKKHCKIIVQYPEPFCNLNQNKSGTFENYRELQNVLQRLKEYHKGGVLFNGERLPKPEFSIKIQSLYL